MNFLLDIQRTFLPEIVLIGFILVNTIISMFAPPNTYRLSRSIAILGIVFAFFATLFCAPNNFTGFGGEFQSNSFTLFCKTLILLSAFFVIFMSNSVIKTKRDKAFEYFTLIFTALLGALCMISANDFLTLFVSMELLTVSTCILIAYSNGQPAKEVSIMYLITAAIASALFMFGVSYLYGFSGLLNFNEIVAFYSENYPTISFTFSLILITLGLIFKIGAVPFQKWVPDVYQGTSYPVAVFLSIIPKLAAFAVLIKLITIFGVYTAITKFIIMIFATLTVFYGSIGAIKQTNIKRFLGYSSITHSGFVLLGFCAMSQLNISAILFYLFSYIFMNLGAFAAVILFNKSNGKDNISDYKGLISTRPYFTVAFSICLLSLAGLPITAGFISKIYLFYAVARTGLISLMFLAPILIATVIALYAYLKIIKTLFEKTEFTNFIDSKFTSIKFILYFCTIITVLLCIFASPVIELCSIVIY